MIIIIIFTTRYICTVSTVFGQISAFEPVKLRHALEIALHPSLLYLLYWLTVADLSADCPAVAGRHLGPCRGAGGGGCLADSVQGEVGQETYDRRRIVFT